MKRRKKEGWHNCISYCKDLTVKGRPMCCPFLKYKEEPLSTSEMDVITSPGKTSDFVPRYLVRVTPSQWIKQLRQTVPRVENVDRFSVRIKCIQRPPMLV